MTARVIGRGLCHDCGADVERRVDKSGIVYENCDGRAGTRLCHAQKKYSRPTSRELIEKSEKPAEPVKNTEKPEKVEEGAAGGNFWD